MSITGSLKNSRIPGVPGRSSWSCLEVAWFYRGSVTGHSSSRGNTLCSFFLCFCSRGWRPMLLPKRCWQVSLSVDNNKSRHYRRLGEYSEAHEPAQPHSKKVRKTERVPHGMCNELHSFNSLPSTCVSARRAVMGRSPRSRGPTTL